jgi:hypothetical protein
MNRDQVIAGAFTCIGLGLGMFMDRVPYLTLDPATKPIELINLILIVLVAVGVPLWITSRVDNIRAKKDLIINELEEFIVQLDKRSSILSSKENFKDLNFELLQLNRLAKTARSMLRMTKSQLGSPIKKDVLECLDEFEARLNDYWRYTTGNNGVFTVTESNSSKFCLKQSNLADQLRFAAKKSKFIVNEL